MRTNTVTENDTSDRETPASGAPTTRNTVAPGLSSPVRFTERDDIRGLRGTLRWTGDLDEMRRDR